VVGVDCFNANYARREKLRNLERAREWSGFEFVPIDLSRGDLSELVEDCDAIFHLAAEPGVRESWGRRFERYVRNNILATQLLLDAVRAHPGKRVVYASSSSIYGNAERMPTPEDVIPQPLSPYGTTKLAGEHLCLLYHANFGVDSVCLRYFTVYGPRQRPDMAFHLFCAAAIADQPIDVFGDGRQTRDFTYVADAVVATRAAASAADVSGEVFNVGGGAQVSVNQTLGFISEFAGRRLDVRYLEPRSGDVQDTGADTSRAARQLGFRPSTTLEEGLRAQFDSLLTVSSASSGET
jgi:UDP-glucose 4-epimerase